MSRDSRLDQHVDRAADHDQMLDVVAANEDEPPMRVDRRHIHHAEPAVASFQIAGATPSAEHESLERPRHERAEREGKQERRKRKKTGFGVFGGWHDSILAPASRQPAPSKKTGERPLINR